MPPDPDDEDALRKEFELAGARALLEQLDAKRERVLRLFPELGPRKYRKRDPVVIFDAKPAKVARHKISNQPRRHLKYPPEMRAQAIALGREGMGSKAIAKRLGAKDAIVHYWLRMEGVKKLSPSEKTSRKRRGHHYSEEFRKTAVERSQHEPIRAVARSMGINDSLIHKWRERKGVSGTATVKETIDGSKKERTRSASAASVEKAWRDHQRPTLGFLAGRPDGRATIAELVEHLGISESNASYRGRRLTANGWAMMPERGVYQITAKGRARLEQGE